MPRASLPAPMRMTVCAWPGWSLGLGGSPAWTPQEARRPETPAARRGRGRWRDRGRGRAPGCRSWETPRRDSTRLARQTSSTRSCAASFGDELGEGPERAAEDVNDVDVAVLAADFDLGESLCEATGAEAGGEGQAPGGEGDAGAKDAGRVGGRGPAVAGRGLDDADALVGKAYLEAGEELAFAGGKESVGEDDDADGGVYRRSRPGSLVVSTAWRACPRRQTGRCERPTQRRALPRRRAARRAERR